MDKCENCVHERICKLWRDRECQDASCFCDDCFEPKQEPVIHAHWIELTGTEESPVDDSFCRVWKCSNCGAVLCTPLMGIPSKEGRCCRCGAHMDEEVQK